MNRIILKTAAFTTALLLAQAAFPGYGVSALGSGAANGTETEFSESAAYYNGGSEYRYYYTEPDKSKIEFLKDGGLELSWDTDSRVMAGVNSRKGIAGISLGKLPVKYRYYIECDYSLDLQNVSGFVAYGTDMQFISGDQHKEVLIADGYTEADFPYDTAPKTVRLGCAEYKIYQYSEEIKGTNLDFEQQVYIALPSENGYNERFLLPVKHKNVTELVDSLVKEEIIGQDEVLDSVGFGITVAADENHKSKGLANLYTSSCSIDNLEDAYSESVSSEEYGWIENFRKGSGDAYLLPGEYNNYKCIWSSDDAVAVENGMRLYETFTPLTAGYINLEYEASIFIEKGGFLFGALCSFKEQSASYSAEKAVKGVLIADVYSGLNSDSFKESGTITAKGMKYDIYYGEDRILYAVPADDKFAERGTAVYSGKIDVLPVLEAAAEAGYISDDVCIDSVCSGFYSVPESAEEGTAMGTIELTRHYINIFKSPFPGHGDPDPRFECEYQFNQKSGKMKVPSSFTATWEKGSGYMILERAFNTKNGWGAYGDLKAVYDADFSGGAKDESVFGIFGNTLTEYGKMKDEFYIIESWDNHNPMQGIIESGTHVETIEADGAEYDVYYLPYNSSQPPHQTGGTYCSVRRENQTGSNHTAKLKNKVSLSEHFDAWRKLGFTDGDACEIGLWLSCSVTDNVECTVNSFDLYGSNEKKEETVKGDADGNGIVNTMDLITVFGYLSGKSEIEISSTDAFDMNSDGKINVIDLILLKNALAK